MPLRPVGGDSYRSGFKPLPYTRDHGRHRPEVPPEDKPPDPPQPDSAWLTARQKSWARLIRRVFAASVSLKDAMKVVYVENYNMWWAQKICAGVDLWLNTPLRPQEASGTSGMKAALNGIPSLSVLDGWWVEGHVEGATSWAIGYGPEVPEYTAVDASSLYDKLEGTILPMYYGRPTSYVIAMRNAIVVNGSFFNTQRMVSQYVANAYQAKTES